jgi:hypothetical protein
MKKLLLLTLLFASNAHANIATAKLNAFDPIHMPVPMLEDYTFKAHVGYRIENLSATPKRYEVCYELTTCKDYAPQTHTLHECFPIDVDSASIAQGAKEISLTASYFQAGWFDIYASTTITDGTVPLKTIDEQIFQVRYMGGK